MTEFLFKLGLSVVMVAVSGGALHWIWTHQIDPIASVAALLQGPWSQAGLPLETPTSYTKVELPLQTSLAPLTGRKRRWSSASLQTRKISSGTRSLSING